MSLFAQWADALATKMDQFNNSQFMHSVMAVCALVATADGEVSKDEQDKIIKLMGESKPLRCFKGNDMGRVFQDYAGQAKGEFSRLDVMTVAGKLKDSPDQADAAVKIGLSIANADGNFDAKEREVVAELCGRLGLNATTYLGAAA